MDKENLIARAHAAMAKAAAKVGGSVMQPSKHSDVHQVGDRFYVALRNVGGILAVYRVRLDGTLKRLKRWPAELEQ